MSKKILFISNHASFFCTHRLNIFKESVRRKLGFRLIFGNSASKSMDKHAIKILNQQKVNYIKLKYSHNSINFFKDISSIIKIIKVIKDFFPDVIHSASPKANLLLCVISKIIKVKLIVLSMSGLGYLFTNKNRITSYKANLFLLVLKFCLKNINKKIIVQNKDDYKFIKKKLKLKKNEIYFIKGGSGVELDKFNNIKKNNTKNIVMISRVTLNKGAKEFLKSAQLLKKKYPDWNFLLVGSKDYQSPDKIKKNYLNYFEKNKIVKLINFTRNIKKILRNSEIFCLPSYREGMPKAVMEALSAGIPVVTTDVIGCKDSIIDGKNGYLCKPYNYTDLAKKLEKLIINKKLRVKFGKNAKDYSKKYFSIKEVTNNIYKIYGF